MADEYARKVAGRIIEQLRAGTAPWLRPWAPGKHFLPYNPVSGVKYRGMNAVWLMAEGFERGFQDARWMTYRQAEGAGAQVRRGEKGTVVQYWQWESREVVRDERGQPVLDTAGRARREDKKRERPRVYSSVVFNAEQIDGLAVEAARATVAELARHELAEALIHVSGAHIEHRSGAGAYYRVDHDRIVLPEREQFTSSDAYYATTLHELGHWTGHGTRLNRDLSYPFGSEGYAREELRAEIASMMLGDELGIGHDPAQHVAYIDSWIRVLEREPREVFRAASDAEKITRYLHSLQHGHAIELEPIRERTFQEPDRMQVQARVIQIVQASPEEFLRRYARLEQAFGGRYVSADLFKELFSDYRAAAENRTRYNAPVHNSAAVLASAQFKRLLADNEYPERDCVLFLTGVPGAGKTTSILDAGQLEPHLRAVYEGQLADPSLALERIEQVLGAGLKPIVLAVHVMPEQALERTLQRYEEMGRGSSLKLIARLQADLPRGLQAIYERHADQAELRILDARDPDHKLMRRGWDELPTLRSEGNYEHIEARLLKYLESRRRAISAGAYEQAFGRAPAFLAGALDRGSGPAQSSVGIEPRPTQSAGDEAVLNASNEQAQLPPSRDYLFVPFAEKDEARRAGAKWDRTVKRWYVPEGISPETFVRWREPALAGKTITTFASVQQEFAEAIAVAGLQLQTLPTMDGRLRRVAVEGDRGAQRSGAYVGFSDGHPAGYIQNFKTGFAESWKSSVPPLALSPEERAHLLSEAQEKLRAREVERLARQREVAQDLERRFGELPLAGAHPYLIAKSVSEEAARQATRGDLRIDAEGLLVIAMRDIDGKFWSVQHVDDEGAKGFARDARIEGTYAMLYPTGQSALKPTDMLMIVEGYATGLTVARATNLPVAVAFMSHNLKPVASALRARHGSELPMFIAGDNDHMKPLELGPNGLPKRNDGKERAEEAAKAVAGYALLPDFPRGDHGTDWNDFERSRGVSIAQAALKRGIDRARLELRQDSQLASDRLALNAARRTGHNAESVLENALAYEGQAQREHATPAVAARFDNQRDAADREAVQQEPTKTAHRGRRR